MTFPSRLAVDPVSLLSRSVILGLTGGSVRRGEVPVDLADQSIRFYDPRPNPNQDVGCCTGCEKAMNFNAAGARFTGTVFGMA